MDLRRQIAVARHWLWLLIAGVVVGAGSAFLVSNALPRTYEATTTLIVGQSLSAANPEYNDVLTSQRLSQTYSRLATTRPLLDRVIGKLGLATTAEELSATVRAQATRDSTLIEIVATDRDPTQAAAIANALSEELLSASPAIQGRQLGVQRYIDDELAALQSQMETAQAEIARLAGVADRTAEQNRDLEAAQLRLLTSRSTYTTLLSFSSTSSPNLLTVVEPAIPALEPATPRVLLNTLLAAIVGLMISLAIVFVVEHLDDSIKSVDDVEAIVGLPTLGGIPRMRRDDTGNPIYRLATLLYPRSPIAEAYRTLRTNVEFSTVDKPLRTLLVTSAVPREGKSVTSANLAIAFAQAGRRTLLVDADLHKPSIHLLFDLPNAQGLSTLFRAGDGAIQPLAHRTEQDHLFVLTSGPLPPNPAELLGSQRFRAIIASLLGDYELVLIDSPPLEAVTDAAILAAFVDGTLLIIEAGRTRRGTAARGREALAKSGGHVLGVVMNRLSQRARGDYYYRDAQGAYGETSDDPPVSGSVNRAKPAQ